MDNSTIPPRFRPRVNKVIPSFSTERNKAMINWWFPLKTDGVTQVIGRGTLKEESLYLNEAMITSSLQISAGRWTFVLQI